MPLGGSSRPRNPTTGSRQVPRRRGKDRGWRLDRVEDQLDPAVPDGLRGRPADRHHRAGAPSRKVEHPTPRPGPDDLAEVEQGRAAGEPGSHDGGQVRRKRVGVHDRRTYATDHPDEAPGAREGVPGEPRQLERRVALAAAVARTRASCGTAAAYVRHAPHVARPRRRARRRGRRGRAPSPYSGRWVASSSRLRSAPPRIGRSRDEQDRAVARERSSVSRRWSRDAPGAGGHDRRGGRSCRPRARSSGAGVTTR